MQVAGYIEDQYINTFLKTLCEGYIVFGFQKGVEAGISSYHIAVSNGWNESFSIGEYRGVEPLKELVFPIRQFVGGNRQDIQQRIVVGVKNCDVASLRIHDYVFLKNEPVDPFYKELREKTVIVSADCTDSLPTCFCTAVGEQPHCKTGYDINLARTLNGYLVEIGSEKGRMLVERLFNFNLLKEVSDMLMKKREENRSKVLHKVKTKAQEYGLNERLKYQDAVKKTIENEMWDDFAKDCVECGACNFVCCSCHCFMLADGKKVDGSIERLKEWDSCLYKNFARVAGGANPRKYRRERLYNRFDKKFNFFPTVLGYYACDGCGRCIKACAGKIDIRKVLKRITDETS